MFIATTDYRFERGSHVPQVRKHHVWMFGALRDPAEGYAFRCYLFQGVKISVVGEIPHPIWIQKKKTIKVCEKLILLL